MTTPLLFSYFDKKADVLKAQYELSKIQKSSVNLGKNREFFCKEFLEPVLPATLNLYQGGEIMDSFGTITGEVDIVLVRNDCPKIVISDVDTYLAEGVFSVLEVKSNLTRAKMKESLETLSKVRELKPIAKTVIKSGYQLEKPFTVIFGFQGATVSTLLDELGKYPPETVDYIGILNRGAIIRKGLLEWASPEEYTRIKGQAAALAFLYYHLIQSSSSFIGRNLKFHKYFEPINNWEG